MSVINASPECGASAVERIKTRMQSKTKVDLFNALLMILLNEPSLNNIDEVKELIEGRTCINHLRGAAKPLTKKTVKDDKILAFKCLVKTKKSA